jgi:hypothetical protein
MPRRSKIIAKGLKKIVQEKARNRNCHMFGRGVFPPRR